MTTDDLELLREYTHKQCEASFAALVHRHLNLVYSAALRQVRSPHLAEEVAQSVFTDLARNAFRLAPGTVLTAWLYQVSRRTAIDVVRREARRQFREQIAVEMNAMNTTASDWAHIEPLLDEAMDTLDNTDRTAILLRYFENKSFREVGATLGTSDDTAQKRVSRAVEKLHEFFNKRGVTIGASGLVVLISANAVQSAPVGLALAITAASIAGIAITPAAIATTSKAIAMTTLQKTVLVASLAATTGIGIYGTHQASLLRGNIAALQQQQAPLKSQIRQLGHERDDLANQLAALRNDNDRLNRNTVELLKLRSMVGTLRQELESQKATAASLSTNSTRTGANPGSYISKDQLSDAGFKTPEAALQTYFQAILSGNYDHVVAAMSAQGRAGALKPDQRAIFERGFRKAEEISHFQGIQLLAKKLISDDRVDVQFLIFVDGNAPKISFQHMHKEGNEWKAGNSLSSWSEGGQIQPFTPTAN